MADAETNINTILTADAEVKRIVNTRIYPLVMPQDPTLPAVTYQRMSNNPVNHLRGASGLMNPHVIINLWGMNYHDVKDLAYAVRKAMDAAIATMPTVLTNEIDGFEPDVNLFVISQDYSCWNSE
jgi:hypothetical protein